MEKRNWGGDRRSGTAEKTERLFGYKYTPLEYKKMKEGLEKLKKESGKTTSRLLYEFLTKE